MLYKFLRSKKGFTLVELTVVATILGILTAVSVPLFGSILKKQRLNDCKNQSTVIAAAVQQAMYGMMDSGKRQEKIIFPTGCDVVDGKNCFILTQDATCFTLGDLRGGYRDRISNISDFDKNNTITEYSYNDGCAYVPGYETEYPDRKDWPENNPQATCFLKKKHLENTAFYTFLENSEYEPGQKIPVCPLADFEDADENNDYFYYILEDGSVHCSNPECREAE